MSVESLKKQAKSYADVFEECCDIDEVPFNQVYDNLSHTKEWFRKDAVLPFITDLKIKLDSYFEKTRIQTHSILRLEGRLSAIQKHFEKIPHPNTWDIAMLEWKKELAVLLKEGEAKKRF